MKKRLLSILFALSALAGGVLSSCGVSEDSSPRQFKLSDKSLTQNIFPTEEGLVAVERDEDFITIYFDRNQGDLRILESLRFAPPPVTTDVILNFLLEGPSTEEAEQGIVTYLPTAEDLMSRQIENDVLVLNFKRGSRLEELSGLQLYLAAGQLVLSLVGKASLEGIRLEIEGSPIALPSKAGDLERPASREDYEDLVGGSPLDFEEILVPPFPPVSEFEEDVTTSNS